MSTWTPKKRAALIKRLRPWIYHTSATSEPCLKIKITQLDAEGRVFRNVTSFGDPDPWPADIETLTTAIIEFLQEDADQQKKHVSYMLAPLYGKGLVPGDDTAPVTVDGTKPQDSDDYELSSGPVEGATTSSAKSQAEYRHLENMHRAYMQGIKDNMENLRAENISLRTRAEGDDARRLNWYKRMDEASVASWKIRKEEKSEQFMQENLRELREIAKPVAFRVINGIGQKLGADKNRPLLPEPSREETLLKQFFSDMNLETEWKNLLSVVSSKRRIMLAAMLDRYKEMAAGKSLGDTGLDPNFFLEQFFGDMQCLCEESGADACEWHGILAVSSPKRAILWNMLAEEFFAYREGKAGNGTGMTGDRPMSDAPAKVSH